MHLASLTGISTPADGGRWNAEVYISVEGDDGVVRSKVVADGNWSNGASGSDSCKTKENGQCLVKRKNLPAEVISVTFSVTNLTLEGYVYDPAANEDGNNGEITVVQ